MFKLDDNLLIELGLGSLPPSEKNRMLGYIYETLEMRVGMKLAQQMSNEQLDAFEAFINRNDEAGALKWLETNFPNYKQVVADELQRLKTEIKTAAPQIVASSQQAAAIQPMQQPAGQGMAPQAVTAGQQQVNPIQQPYGVYPQNTPSAAYPSEPATPQTIQQTATPNYQDFQTQQQSQPIDPAATSYQQQASPVPQPLSQQPQYPAPVTPAPAQLPITPNQAATYQDFQNPNPVNQPAFTQPVVPQPMDGMGNPIGNSGSSADAGNNVSGIANGGDAFPQYPSAQ